MEWEWACQRLTAGGWDVVGLGPTSKDNAEQDRDDWQRDCPGESFRIVRRPVMPWEAAVEVDRFISWD
jgi:hypothetical protein